ncbi:MAG TPA: nickel pincer cofactor biosynthesis protein LarC [Thermoanaerobaculia bacterium]|nr:nickel pincer cofactor biosynthesis protein LarC [Thermoanaerobaculia bacterium]
MASYHLDCSSGLAGDMFLGACLDLGMPLAVVADAVARLGLSGVTVEARKAQRGGFAGTRFRVLLDGRPLEGPDPWEEGDDPGHAHPGGHDHGHPHSGGHDHRGLAEIRELIVASSLAPAVAARALRLFQRLGEAEAKVHGMALDEVHFHEVGAIDSIVDLVGAAAAIEHLAPERLTCGPVNVGSGRVRTAHGNLPVPAPATAELLRGAPIYGGPGGELTTPTGAVLLAELVDAFVDMPPLVLEAAGFGLGRKEVATQPNGARLLRGQAVAARAEAASEDAPRIMVIECEVDNLPGEGFGFLMESLFAAGALDVYFTSVQMKKNRPGTLVTVLCRRERLEALAGALLVESGSLGCRYHMAARFEAEREVVEVETAFGTVRVKRARLDGKPLAAAPEFEDCRRLALSLGVPWRDVYRAALAAAPGP